MGKKMKKNNLSTFVSFLNSITRDNVKETAETSNHETDFSLLMRNNFVITVILKFFLVMMIADLRESRNFFFNIFRVGINNESKAPKEFLSLMSSKFKRICRSCLAKVEINLNQGFSCLEWWRNVLKGLKNPSRKSVEQEISGLTSGQFFRA